MMINFPNYDFGQPEQNKPSKSDNNQLLLVGVGLLLGYLIFDSVKEDALDGGKLPRPKPSEVDPEELKKGIKVESEHTTHPDVAEQIALDHLGEDTHYYTHLEGIHKENPRKYYVAQDNFEKSYKKHNGNYQEISKELLNIDSKRSGNILANNLKMTADWWSLEKYPALGKENIKNNISEETFKESYNRNNGNYVAIAEELIKSFGQVERPDSTLRTYLQRSSWWSKEKYPPKGNEAGNKARWEWHKENPIKDPEGGLTKEGREHFGGHLQEGVKHVHTLEDLKRWGMWARRFYGRSILPPMKDHNGQPTRIALDAQAWGCKIPKNKKEAKIIAKRGTEALRYYKELKKKGVKKHDSVSFKICS